MMAHLLRDRLFGNSFLELLLLPTTSSWLFRFPPELWLFMMSSMLISTMDVWASCCCFYSTFCPSPSSSLTLTPSLSSCFSGQSFPSFNGFVSAQCSTSLRVDLLEDYLFGTMVDLYSDMWSDLGYDFLEQRSMQLDRFCFISLNSSSNSFSRKVLRFMRDARALKTSSFFSSLSADSDLISTSCMLSLLLSSLLTQIVSLTGDSFFLLAYSFLKVTNSSAQKAPSSHFSFSYWLILMLERQLAVSSFPQSSTLGYCRRILAMLLIMLQHWLSQCPSPPITMVLRLNSSSGVISLTYWNFKLTSPYSSSSQKWMRYLNQTFSIMALLSTISMKMQQWLLITEKNLWFSEHSKVENPISPMSPMKQIISSFSSCWSALLTSRVC